jgi:hypothetical protein
MEIITCKYPNLHVNIPIFIILLYIYQASRFKFRIHELKFS